ncbi:unnamed protein product [Effrenium voratum]|nr:unnamed protein product [Effrenium voratum]
MGAKDVQPATRTMEDYFQWRREQQPRRDALREARAERRQQLAARSRRRGSARAAAQSTRRLEEAAVQQAETPEARAAWLREVDSVNVRRQSKNRQPGKPLMDAPVGYRSVRSSQGDTVAVPIFRAPEGGRYYVSPLTSKRVAIP